MSPSPLLQLMDQAARQAAEEGHRVAVWLDEHGEYSLRRITQPGPLNGHLIAIVWPDGKVEKKHPHQ